MTDLTALISALEKATGPDRELDAMIYCWDGGYNFIRIADRTKNIIVRVDGFKEVQSRNAPYCTANIDAALAFMRALLPKDSVFAVLDSRGHCRVRIDLDTEQSAYGATLPIAIMLATLRAKQAEMNHAEWNHKRSHSRDD
jgi:hypothetical protein